MLTIWWLGCTAGSPESESTSTVPQLDCADGVSSTIVQAQVGVIEETGDSYHEMVACGGLAYDLAASVEEILVLSLLESNGVEVPGGYVYDGAGHYLTSSDSSTMSVSYFYGDDSEAGLEDELVVYDLFDFDNYLLGVTTELDVLAQEVLVSYSSTGPLVELLGRGPTPDNPMRLGVDEIESPYRLGRLKMVAEVQTNDVRPGATVTYTLSTKPQRLNPLLGGNAELVFELTSSSTLAESGAVLTSTSMGVDYQDSPGTLTGDITFQLRGGGLDLDGVYTFQESTYAEIDWWCP